MTLVLHQLGGGVAIGAYRASLADAAADLAAAGLPALPWPALPAGAERRVADDGRHLVAGPGGLGFEDEAPLVAEATAWAAGEAALLAAQAARTAAPPPTLAERRVAALARVDAAAEAARARWLTPGAGQALEYEATRREAAAAAAAADPLDPALYPHLVAEQTAAAAIGQTVSLRQVADQVAAEAAAWLAVSAAIKAVRRAAKARLATAADEVEIAAILTGLAWPPAPPA